MILLIFGVESDKGIKRTLNEDCYDIIADTSETPAVFIVADGMGGHSMGEVASRIAVNTLKSYILQEKECFCKNKDIIISIKDAINIVNEEILNASPEKDERIRMGTTLVAAFVCEKKIYIANIGDSRAYRIRSGEIKKLTVDHSYIQILLENGSITEDEARNHPEKNKITKALGFYSEVEPDVFTYDMEENDIFLLCSDGLTNMVLEKDILDVCVSENNLQSVCSILVDKANANGGDDNITIILFKE